MTLHLRPSNGEDVTTASFRVKPDGDMDPAGEAGWFLQRERERLGKTLADAALETRINAKYLHAIEHGLLQDLPNRSYVLGYIRVYSEFLGLEADPMVEHYKAMPSAAGAGRAKPGKSGRGAALGMAAAAAVFIIALTGAVWYLAPDILEGPDRQTAKLEPQDPEPATDVDADVLPTGSIQPEQTVDPEDVEAQALDEAVPTIKIQQRGFSDSDDEDAVTPSADSLQPSDKAPTTVIAPDGGDPAGGLTEFIRQHVTEAETTADANAPSPEGRTFGKTANARLVLTAKQPVWIRVEDADGNIMITRTLQPGDAYRVPNRRGLVLIARDGGALDYSIDGQSKGAIGATGEIVVGRSLDIDHLKNAGS